MTTYFTFSQQAGKNFTPSAKICEFAKAHHLETSNHYGKTVLHYPGSGKAVYDRYEIEPADNGMEKGTIYLEDI